MKEELQTKLNKEYEKIGTISISEFHQEEIPISNIDYVESIMSKIEPLNTNEPIIVEKNWCRENTFLLIDGYHRLKNKLQAGESKINTIVLDKFNIKRKDDSLYTFLESLIGSTIKFVDDEILVVDDRYYEIKTNEGCGGCSSGWSSLEVLDSYINKKLKVKTVESKDENGDEYNLYINGKMVAKVDTGWGNGYYGGDFEVSYRN